MMEQMETLNVNDMNIPTLTVDEMIEVMADTYLTCIRDGMPVSRPKPIYMWGGIGIGKSQAVKELAERLKQKTGKRVEVVDVRLSTQSPVELQGLLMPSKDRETTEYIPQKTYQFEACDKLIRKELSDADIAFSTPRSWEGVSFNMKLLYDTKKEYSYTLSLKNAATIGKAEEEEFKTWLETHELLPKLSDILAGICRNHPKRPDLMHATAKSLLAYVENTVAKGKKVSLFEMENICAYVNHFPVDFTSAFYRQLMAVDDGMTMQMMKVQRFNYWVHLHGYPGQKEGGAAV